MQYHLRIRQQPSICLSFINFIVALESMLLLFFYDEETLQKWRLCGLWGLQTLTLPPKRVINPMQSHSAGVGAIMIKLIETCKNKQLWVRRYYLMDNKVTAKLISVYWYFCFVLFLECSKNKNTGLLRSFQSSIVSGYAWGYLSSINAITFYGLK